MEKLSGLRGIVTRRISQVYHGVSSILVSPQNMTKKQRAAFSVPAKENGRNAQNLLVRTASV
jgi:hypothetical protein